MTAEMWTIIGVGIALAVALLPGQRAMRRDLTVVARDVSDLRGEVATLREQMAREMGELREHVAREMGELRERMAREMGELSGRITRRRKTPKTN